jgi:murein DD-endopeptidase MepM/ murein hydrolase activator NlpD
LHIEAILDERRDMVRVIALATALAAACAATAPVSYGGGPQSAPAVMHLVRYQDETALSDYALRREEIQPFDPGNLPRTHRVSASESLHDIATRYQIPILALIAYNGLEPPYALSHGRELHLPPPRFHIVASGETLDTIADRYAIDPRSLALFNRLQQPFAVREGDRLFLPATAAAAVPQAPVVRLTPEPVPPEVRAGARFAMPLRGAVVSSFGAQDGGGRLDGIEIGGREGDLIRAAAAGTVVYAGQDVPGYGALVLVRHADNYVTAYGFNRRALVGEGQRVEAGTAVAELGPRPHGRARLLFQVRRGSAAVDPEPLLGLR